MTIFLCSGKLFLRPPSFMIVLCKCCSASFLREPLVTSPPFFFRRAPASHLMQTARPRPHLEARIPNNQRRLSAWISFIMSIPWLLPLLSHRPSRNVIDIERVSLKVGLKMNMRDGIYHHGLEKRRRPLRIRKCILRRVTSCTELKTDEQPK